RAPPPRMSHASFSETSGNGARRATRPTPASSRSPARSANTTASSCATRWSCAADRAQPGGITYAPRTAASSTRRTAGSSWAFASRATPRIFHLRHSSCSSRHQSRGASPMSHPAEILFANDIAPDVATEAEDILAGLTAPQKRISPKYLYDQRGSELFDQICELPEYYPTRTELKLMHAHLPEIAGLVGPRAAVIELGA